MLILLDWRNLKNCCFKARIDTIFVQAQIKTGILRRSRDIGFKFFVVCQFRLDYAPIALFGNLCYRRSIMLLMLFDAAGINLWSLIRGQNKHKVRSVFV